MWDGLVDRVACTPKRDDGAQTEEDDTHGVDPFRTLATRSADASHPMYCMYAYLWPISEGADHDDEDETDVEFQENLKDILSEPVERIRGSRCGGGGDQLFNRSTSRNQLCLDSQRGLTKKKAR